jgi:uncharacterized protein (DUF362 family)
MAPDAKPCGVILAGTHPAAVDCAAATLMGFDWRKIRMLKSAFAMRELNFAPFPPGDVEVISNQPAWSCKLAAMGETFEFKPHFGWTGGIESQAPH